MFWKNDFLSKVCTNAVGNIKKISYCLDNIWYDAEIISSETAGAKHIFTVEIPGEVSGTVTGLRFADGSGNITGEQSENIIKAAGHSFIMKITVSVSENQEGL